MSLVHVSFVQFQEEGEEEGVIAFGRIRQVQVGLNTYYYIHDGADWEHPVLQSFATQPGDVAIYYKPSEGVVELHSYPEDRPLAVLDVAPAREPIKLRRWLMDPFNAGKATELRRTLRERQVPLNDSIFCEIPDGIIVAEGIVQVSWGGLNNLGGDAEVIWENDVLFYCRPPPVPLLVNYVGKTVQVIKQRGCLMVIEPGIGDA